MAGFGCPLRKQEKRTTVEACVLASYFVSVANRYLDKCGGGPELVTLTSDGHIIENNHGVFPEQEMRFKHCEQEIGKELRALLLRGGEKR
jgi:hypothetical protein